jgi:uncharacterized membrane protein
MKTKELFQKIALFIIPLILVVITLFLESNISNGSNRYLLFQIAVFNATTVIVYLFTKRNSFILGDEKMQYLGRKIDSLLLAGQVCLIIILYLFNINFWGISSLLESYIFVTMILYGNYYSLSPMPTESVSVYFEDEDTWRKVCKLRGRLIFGFGVIGLLSVLYCSPNGIGFEYMYLIVMIIAITFVITYFYAKREYLRKFNH